MCDSKTYQHITIPLHPSMHQGERLGGHPSMASRLPPSLKPLMINARQANDESESRSQTLNLITAVFHKTLASAPSPRFSTGMGQLPSDFLAPTSPLPAADFAMSPRFTVTQVNPAFPSPAPSPRPGQTPHSVSSFEGEESSVTEDDKEADRTDEDQRRAIIRPNPPVRPPAPAPRRREVCREAYQPVDDEEDVSHAKRLVLITDPSVSFSQRTVLRGICAQSICRLG